MSEPTETMLKRFTLIAPLLEEDLEAGELRRRRQEALANGKISERTLRRYIAAYQEHGLEGLRPKTRSDSGLRRALTEEVYRQALVLKEELPERSTRRIIEILTGEKHIRPGEIARSTLARHLFKAGLTAKERVPQKSRRFQKEHRNSLWQADIKYGPHLPNPKDPKKTLRTYFLGIIDDATRLLCHGEFYLDQKLPVLEDCFRKALLKRGIPEAIYIDNGKIFKDKSFIFGCAGRASLFVTISPSSHPQRV